MPVVGWAIILGPACIILILRYHDVYSKAERPFFQASLVRSSMIHKPVVYGMLYRVVGTYAAKPRIPCAKYGFGT